MDDPSTRGTLTNVMTPRTGLEYLSLSELLSSHAGLLDLLDRVASLPSNDWSRTQWMRYDTGLNVVRIELARREGLCAGVREWANGRPAYVD